jgi:threonine/homoserine/homoserine lactone efflux protein
MNTAYFLQGLALGFGSGISPGPFLALVIAASLRGGFRNGAIVALSPLITDAPIIVVCVTVLSKAPSGGVAALSIAGAGVLSWYAYEAFRDARTASLSAMRVGATSVQPASHALRQGVIANFLNPSPWMFWITIGGPLLAAAWQHGVVASAAFLLPFYGLLVGSKVAIAGAVGAGRSRLSDVGYRRLLTGAGLLLVGLALSLLRGAIVTLLG